MNNTTHTETEIIERLPCDEGTEIIVAKISTGFSVVLRDIDADAIVPGQIIIYPTFERAHAAAVAIVAKVVR